MSFANVRTSIKSLMDSLDISEHDDAFNDQNIAETLLEESYQIVDQPISAPAPNQTVYVFEYPINIKLFFDYKENRNGTSVSIDQALGVVDAVISALLAPAYKSSLNADGIKDIVLSGISSPQPLSSTNDRAFYYELNLIYKQFCTF